MSKEFLDNRHDLKLNDRPVLSEKEERKLSSLGALSQGSYNPQDLIYWYPLKKLLIFLLSNPATKRRHEQPISPMDIIHLDL